MTGLFESDPGFTYYEKDACIPNPCLSGGTCSKDNETIEFNCTCIPRYSGLLCEIGPYGWSSQRPGKSCKDIALSGDGLYDGKYWIDPENSGNVMQVYCEMSFEVGGCLLVSNVIIPAPAVVPSLTLSQSYRNISNYNDNKTIISASALGQLRQLINFTRLRFHCRQQSIGRTLHLVLTTDSKGKAVVHYFSSAHNTRPLACGSYYQGPGDNSLLAGQCHLWGINGKWVSDSESSEWRLHNYAFSIQGSIWSTGSYCDSHR
ncbi:hypothetical protein AC249_AIPGENE3611 [Exaiptasia diaphana]|nr:hypothetical protein AC249_AIPGENE3611 [Exaiptasia diaphana]